MDGIGDTQVESIKFFFSNRINTKITKDLINHLEISEYKIQTKNGIFSNKNLMFTGGFLNMSSPQCIVEYWNNRHNKNY